MEKELIGTLRQVQNFSGKIKDQPFIGKIKKVTPFNGRVFVGKEHIKMSRDTGAYIINSLPYGDEL